jgi:hypothetical protein
MQQRGAVSLHLVLTIFLGLGMVLFGVLAVIAFSDNENIHATLDQRVASAQSQAKEEQKQQDAEENRKANDLPYRLYKAEAIDGGFQLQIPKTWSLYVGRNSSGTTQVDLAADPNVVIQNLGPGALNTHAFRLQLLRKNQTEIVKSYDAGIKKKKLSSKGITVSGIPATQFDGEIDSQRHNGSVVVLAVRDKTMILSTEDPKYRDEFNKILSTAVINP